MRIVLDCNVVVSAARVNGACRDVIARAVRQHEIVLSKPILSEYEAVARRPRLARYRETMEFAIRSIARLAIFVEPTAAVFRLRDPDDEVYLATADAGEATLISGNTRDFTRPRYGSVEVWSPRVFLDRTTSADRAGSGAMSPDKIRRMPGSGWDGDLVSLRDNDRRWTDPLQPRESQESASLRRGRHSNRSTDPDP